MNDNCQLFADFFHVLDVSLPQRGKRRGIGFSSSSYLSLSLSLSLCLSVCLSLEQRRRYTSDVIQTL
jgi:hypothetical protein